MDIKNLILLIPIFLPFTVAILLGLVKRFERKQRNIIISIAVFTNIIVMFILLANKNINQLHLFRINSLLDIFIKLDKLGIMFSMMVSILWICTAFYSFEYMTHEGKEDSFYIFFIMTLGVTNGIAFSGNLVTMYIFYEFLTLVTFPLVIHNGSKEAMRSGKKYLIYSFFGATLILCGIILLMMTGTNFEFIAHGSLNAYSNGTEGIIIYAFLLLFIGFGVKAALVPLHSWLPAAMVAPTPVSALLHAVAVVKSGIFALVRVIYYVVGFDTLKNINGTGYISTLVIVTILLGSLLAYHQDNLKRRLAYSTVSQLGYIILGIILLNNNGLVGGLMHMINHAFIKITLFFCVGAITYVTGKKYIHQIRGIGKEMPITMWCFSIASISLIGLPPTNGFVSKWYLALGGLRENRISFVIILLASALLTAAYLIPIIIVAFFPGNDHIKEEKHIDPPPLILVPIILLTGAVVILGLYPNVVLNYIKDIVSGVI